MTRFHPLALLAIALLVGAGCLQAPAPGGTNTTADTRHALMQQELRAMTACIQADLDAFDASTARTASALGTTGLSGPDADAAVTALAAGHPATLSAIVVGPDGTVLAAAPESALAVLGLNIANQDAIARVLSTRQPAMGRYFTLRQGPAGVAIVAPVFAPNGTFSGAVSTAFSPQALVAPRANASKARAPFSFIVAQPDGVLIYHANASLAGTSTFDEPVFRPFPDVLDLARRYGAEPSGYAAFTFYREGTEEVVPKETFWETVSLHGTGWRVLVVAETA
jgi:hypothetical protein